MLVSQTRRTSLHTGTVSCPIYTSEYGYITHIDITKINAAIKRVTDEAEVVLQVSIGHFVAYQDQIGYVLGADIKDMEKISRTVCDAVRIELQRDIDMDPNDGLNQLETIAWTSISTAKSNPQPGLLTIRSLRDIWARWAVETYDPPKEIYPIVYADDVPDKLLNTFETLAIVSSESIQHQNFIEVLRTFSAVYERLNEGQQKRVQDIVLRILSAMGDFVLTAPLEAELQLLITTFSSAPHPCHDTIKAIEEARNKFRLSTGKLNSRSTRVKER